QSKGSEEERVPGWGELLTFKQSYSVIISRLFLDPIWWLFVSWLPIYLNEKFRFDVKQIGYFAWVPYIGAAAGSLSGGWISGWLIQKGWTVNRARKSAIVGGAVITFFALLVSAYAATPVSAVLSIAVILFGFQVTINNIQTLPSDFLTGKSVGSLAGLGGTAASIGTIASMWFVPMLTTGNNWGPFFFLGASLVPLGVAALFIFAGEIKRIELKKVNENFESVK
ncbi:MAG: MFS transporter, partial [Syntrophothermus sp.]